MSAGPSLADGTVLVMAAALVVASGVLFWSPGGHATHVEIHAPGQAAQRLALTTDRRIDIPGAHGASTVEIRDRRARFVASPCPGKLCMLSGWLSRAGDTAICLPNAVTLQLAGAVREYDSINY